MPVVFYELVNRWSTFGTGEETGGRRRWRQRRPSGGEELRGADPRRSVRRIRRALDRSGRTGTGGARPRPLQHFHGHDVGAARRPALDRRRPLSQTGLLLESDRIPSFDETNTRVDRTLNKMSAGDTGILSMHHHRGGLRGQSLSSQRKSWHCFLDWFTVRTVIPFLRVVFETRNHWPATSGVFFMKNIELNLEVLL